MPLLPASLSPARALTEFILADACEGAHALVVAGREQHLLGFGKWRDVADCNPLEMRDFIATAEKTVEEREGFKTLFCLTSFVGALPPESGKTIRFNDLTGRRLRYGWLVDAEGITALTSGSLLRLVGRERRTKLRTARMPEFRPGGAE